MDKTKLQNVRKQIRSQLDACVSFWLNNGIDKENGGVYTCLDRQGKVYSTDKSVWMQGRCAWTFAWLCNVYGKKQEWLDAAGSCLDFMEKYCINREKGDRMYFTVTGDGKPLRQRRYFFSETFYCMANAEYYGLTGDKVYLERAIKAYNMYWDLWHGAPDPTGLGSKTITETRTGRSFANAMIFLNMSSILVRVHPEGAAVYDERSKECVHDIFAYHVHPELGCLLENVGPNGEARMEFTEGRIVNPGHDIEGAWFIEEYANRTGDKELRAKAEDIFNKAFEAGWDNEYGGLLYFIDALGNPPEAYEHDMKLWWPHNEILIASLMFYRDTGKEEYLEKFYKTFDYCCEVFSDEEYGEWYGYLRRDGKPTMPPCKGSTFKGPFHLPRMLSMVDVMIGEILGE
ncbi:MAG: AGE family epimerase/isomerase [Clostridia bacterium]|nr:AGE family epimerase/isomerase [Clostridia bacterium]